MSLNYVKFDAWKYEREKHLAIIPFIRTIEIELENKLIHLKGETFTNNTTHSTITKKWNQVRKGLEKTFNAFTRPVA